MQSLELWGGSECTVNRVGDTYLDQCRLSGHHDRLEDIDLLARFGFDAIRFPVLWERVAPDDQAAPYWQWPDERLGRLRAFGIRPIIGLVHHGSGPRHTNLLDESFAVSLGCFAGRVAERYPWIDEWAPVNEPLTTARFSALYGLWYPHHREERSFWLALLNQIDGTRLAMRAVRRVNPAARLMQTDDLGRTYATTVLADQAAFDNLRRWAGWDMLFGRLTPDHPLWARIAGYGFGDRLRRIADDPCPPAVIGINHYLTSDRFLDHRLQRYPARTHGANQYMAYADIEAVRVVNPGPAGLAGALSEAWDRYATPLAITEVHNGCTREEQLRWAAEAWDTAGDLRERGVAVAAVTAWALFGSNGWDRLLTAPGTHECGIFDVAFGTPRPTALATLWKGLPAGVPRHPVACQPGWWLRPERFTVPPLPRPAAVPRAALPIGSAKLLICGATGTLGQAFARACVARGIPHVLAGRDVLDLNSRHAMADVLDAVQPWAVINATGWVRVDDAEHDESGCRDINATGAVALAAACDQRDIQYLGFSSDLVFDGRQGRPYLESDAPRPVNVYGRSKAAMEKGCAMFARALIVRTAAFFSPYDAHNFAVAVRNALAANRPFPAASDHVVTPTFVPHLVDASLNLLIDGCAGIWHLTNGEAMSWADFARRIAMACGHDPAGVRDVAGSSLGWRARRPRTLVLTSEKGPPVGSLEMAIAHFAHEIMYQDIHPVEN